MFMEKTQEQQGQCGQQAVWLFSATWNVFVLPFLELPHTAEQCSAPLGWKNMEWAVGETLGELGVSPADVDAEA